MIRFASWNGKVSLMKNDRFVLWLLVILLGLSGLSALFPASSLAASGASFLKLGVGARALGLGSAYTAIAEDSTALHWNPAGLAFVQKAEVSATHAELFAGSRSDFLGYAQTVKRASSSESLLSFGVSALYLNQPDLDGRSESRSATGDFNAGDLAVTFAGAKNVGPLSLGAGVKVLRSQIAGETASGLALDIGTVWKRPGSKLQLGAAVQNLGPQMKFAQDSYALPLTLSGGAGYHIARGLLVSADLKTRPYDSKTSLSFGTEFAPVSMLALRCGYLAEGAASKAPVSGGGFEKNAANLTGFGFGLGLKFSRAALDYAFTPSGELGNSQRLSLSVKF